MQKLITVSTHTNKGGNDFHEEEYPKVNELLEQGYKVVNVYPITTAATGSYMFALVIVLEKE